MNALDERLHHGLDTKINLWSCILCMFFFLFRIFACVCVCVFFVFDFLRLVFARVFDACVFCARALNE